MKTTLMIVATLGLLVAGCQTAPSGEPSPNGAETTRGAPEEPADDGQDAKDLVFVLGVNGMD